jgi:peptidoglycan/LPS O-acetylase OafA/YrhL
VNFQGLIDFNKYTLALAAASFVYTLEKFVPMSTASARYLVLGVLIMFLASALLGILVFAASTRAMHGDKAEQKGLATWIRRFGTAHAVSLCIGLLVLGAMLYSRVIEPPAPVANRPCCCPCTPQG